MSTFIWTPSYSSNATDNVKVLSSSFGDGYEQRTADGINYVKKVWELQFNGISSTQATSIRNFLKPLLGITPFDWTDPDGETLRYVCRTLPRTFDEGNNCTFRLTFEQVFGS